MALIVNNAFNEELLKRLNFTLEKLNLEFNVKIPDKTNRSKYLNAFCL